VELRISYAQFLTSVKRNHNFALSELSIAQGNKHSFEEGFIIYRLQYMISLVINCRKTIENELSAIADEDNFNSNAMDAISLMTYENNFKKCKANIENVAFLHMKFWSLLLDERPGIQIF
jgi:hypothetical protein